MASWLEDITQALTNLGGIAHYDAIYEEVSRIRPKPLPQSWKKIVQRTVQDHAPESDGFRGTPIFYSVEGIGSGIWGLQSQLTQSPSPADISEPEAPYRVKQEIYRVLRDTEIVRKLKALYKNRCQLCGVALSLSNAVTYSEGHHIQPLGQPHNGPDIAANIVILCPNHHVLLDYGAMRLDSASLHCKEGHYIGSQYIEYHNSVLHTEMKPPFK